MAILQSGVVVAVEKEVDSGKLLERMRRKRETRDIYLNHFCQGWRQSARSDLKILPFSLHLVP